MTPRSLLLPAAALATVLAACAPLPPSVPVAVRASDVAQPAAACPALAGRRLPGVRVTEARLVAGGSTHALDPVSGQALGPALPEHCLVRGRIDERTGADGKPYYTGFELRLPSAFNGRFLYQGGGGNDGVVYEAVGRNTGADGWADNALARGFAAVSTDAGHQSAGPEFGLDPQARIEHAYLAHERTAETANELIVAYYGRAADRSYFVGCSGGGRQGMMFTQRYPDVFDGVVVVAPAMRVASGATIAAAWTVQEFMTAAPKDAAGRPLLAQALSDAQLKRVAQEVVSACHAKDGVADAIVEDPLACNIDPYTLVCPAAGAGCLQPAQAQALAAVMAGPRNSKGPLYFPRPWDPGIGAPGWRDWTLGTDQTPARDISLMGGALGYEFATPPDPALSTLNFDFERDPERLAAFAKIFNSAADVDLTRFRGHGGKLIIIHGTGDPIFSAFESVDYQRRMTAAHPDAAGFARTFLVPGMNHCSGGPATDVFDGLAAIQAWVEDDRAPDRILAHGSAGAMAGVSRPLCPWPQVARYSGGDARLASSFTCR